jgi:uncharacterized BrkB/YihY/UPF0761 family membrane protein
MANSTSGRHRRRPEGGGSALLSSRARRLAAVAGLLVVLLVGVLLIASSAHAASTLPSSRAPTPHEGHLGVGDIVVRLAVVAVAAAGLAMLAVGHLRHRRCTGRGYRR